MVKGSGTRGEKQVVQTSSVTYLPTVAAFWSSNAHPKSLLIDAIRIWLGSKYLSVPTLYYHFFAANMSYLLGTLIRIQYS